MEKNVKLNSNFYLTTKELNMGQEVKTTKPTPTNFIFVIDVSGSMHNDLALIRKQLKNKLPNLTKVGDTITLIWFSGKDQAGILKEEVEVRALTDLQNLNDAIDTYLKSICLTAFAKPLTLAKQAIERMKINRPDSVFSLIFLTDGYNNDCSWSDVMSSLNNLNGDLAASTFVEYGYYADTRRITEMAESIGGEKVDAAHFDDYDVLFEAKMQKSYSNSKKVVVKLSRERKFNFAFVINDGEIIVYSINENNEVLVPENTKSINYFASEPIGLMSGKPTDEEVSQLYAALYVLSDKLQYEFAEDVFAALGDVHLYNIFSTAYGKQKLIAFKNLVKECVTDKSKRFVTGYSPNLQTDENIYCVMNLIDDLTADDEALFYPHHDDFNYKRIGAKKVQQTGLTDEEKKMILESKSINAIKEIVDKAEGRDVKFEYNDKTKGYPISDIVWSSNRANLSVRIRYEGYVELPKNKFGIDKVDTFIYRTYSIIKDGILNISKLPITASRETMLKLANGGVKAINLSDDITTIDFSSLPIVNKKMVKSISAKKLAEKEYNLLELQALEKVYKYYENELYPRISQGFLDKYGAEAEAWLKEIGITEYNGFAPKTTTEEGGDVYMAVELNTKIVKYSTLPSVNALLKKIYDNKNLNAPELLMKIAYDDYNTQINSSIYTALTDDNLKKEILKNWLTKAKNRIRMERRNVLQEIAQIKFSLILSKKWFEEFTSFDEDTLIITSDKGEEVTFKFEMKEKEIAV